MIPAALPFTGESRIFRLSADSFRSHVREDLTPNGLWLVFFTQTHSTKCQIFESIFAKLSLLHASPVLRFGLLNLSNYPELDSTLDSCGGELPCVVLYHNGNELCRLPRSTYDGTAPIPWTLDGLTEAFKLQEASRHGYSRAVMYPTSTAQPLVGPPLGGQKPGFFERMLDRIIGTDW
ncbi:hypothetical protein PAPYR_239 [Paratrimastix pyriformis]|uniref:Thioredoxin domain-containing protein n=1 Tax=Paratrimastix pyriformis TaxID=342808 RepID=A0ABQ8UV73_9EUKA|nr:hypothetical protein PAPYR_239 [Paratrimastix pyriformis]